MYTEVTEVKNERMKHEKAEQSLYLPMVQN